MFYTVKAISKADNTDLRGIYCVPLKVAKDFARSLGDDFEITFLEITMADKYIVKQECCSGYCDEELEFSSKNLGFFEKEPSEDLVFTLASDTYSLLYFHYKNREDYEVSFNKCDWGYLIYVESQELKETMDSPDGEYGYRELYRIEVEKENSIISVTPVDIEY